MLIIGERINGLFKDVARAIQEKDKTIIQNLAKKQVNFGADMLDLNTGPASLNPQEDIVWLVNTVEEVTDKPVAIDSPKTEVLERGLEAVGRSRPMINSTTAQKEKLDLIIPLAVKYKASVIGLTMSEKGIPSDAHAKSELALQIIAACMEHGVTTEDIYIDPLILPVNVAQAQVKDTLAAIKNIRSLSDPAPHVILGLSNVSQGAKYRGLINRTYLVMAMAMGLDGVIMDPMDTDLMDALRTARILLNQSIYCESYLKI
ncbi:MAG: dihydropteroate synthase [Candidatus Omnitrophota bacterium]